MKKQKKISRLEKISLMVTEWVGTPISIGIHTLFFIGIFGLRFWGIRLDQIELILTTAVSLEAIYLALFIQMTVNRNTKSLQGVESDIDDIQEDVEDLGENVDDISEDIDVIQEGHAETKDITVHLTSLKVIAEQLQQIQVELAALKENK